MHENMQCHVIMCVQASGAVVGEEDTTGKEDEKAQKKEAIRSIKPHFERCM